ncbi:MAG: hypothetical protein AB7H90_06660 [Alphaproteobacteria bacterium]
MSIKTVALAAMLLAGGIGAAQAQQQTVPVLPPGHPSVLPPGHPPVVTTPPYRQQVPAAVPLEPHIDAPRVNPSAAGTLREGERVGLPGSGGEPARGHTGSVGVNANTHPFKSLRAGGEPREEGMTAPAAPYPVPHSTMNRQDGR